MIICVSVNPAIDRRLHVSEMQVGSVNRVHAAQQAAGGKAAHVAFAARALGAEVTWVGFLGGATGEECAHGISALGIHAISVRTKSATRVNLEIIEENKRITEVLEPGGAVESGEINKMIVTCRHLFAQNREKAHVVLAGSLAPGVPTDFFAELTGIAHENGCKVLLDTSGEALKAGMQAFPDLVKPNREEAETMLGRPVRDLRSAVDAAERMLAYGARSAAISLGTDGILWLASAESRPIIARPPRVDVHSTVGCGDATIAGFATAMTRRLDPEDTLRLAIACGAANCLANMPGMIDAKNVEKLFSKVSVKGTNDYL